MSDPVNPSSRPVKDSSPLANPKSRSLKDSSALANPNARPLNDLRSFASEELKRHAESQAASRREGNHAKEPVGIQRATTEMPALRGFTDPPQKARRQKNLPPPDGGKPFAFALEKGDDGVAIWWGMLAARITIINATRFDGKITSITQPPLQKTEYLAFTTFDGETTKPKELGWWGDVYAYWEATDGGAISAMEIKGPDQPDGEDIGELGVDLSRAITDGKYWVKIGNCPEEGDIDQQISSDIPWFITSVKGGSGGGSDSDGSEGSDGSSSGSTGSPGSTGSLGSDKSTAIVPVSFYSTGYAALFTMESPDVRFEDVLIIKPRRKKCHFMIDPKFVEVCEKDSIVAVSACPSSPAQIGAVVEGKVLRLQITARKIPDSVAIKISAIRRGFAGMRFPTRTEAQFLANEKFLNSAYPRK